MKKFHIPDYSWALAAMLFWGFSFIWSSQLLKYYQPVTIILVRLVLSSALLFAIIHLFSKPETILRKDFGLILLSSLFNPFLYFLGENYGLKYSSPTVAAVVIATIPVFSPLVAWLTLREKLTPVNFVGIGVSFAGVIIMLVGRDFSLNTDVRGVLSLFGAVLAALFYSVLLRRLTSKYSALTLIAWQNLIGIFLFLPLFLAFDAGTVLSVKLNAEIIIAVLLLSIFASSVSFVFFAHSVKLIGVSKSNIFSNLIPVFTAIFSYFLLAEVLTYQKIAGIGLVIAGVYLSERNKRKV